MPDGNYFIKVFVFLLLISLLLLLAGPTLYWALQQRPQTLHRIEHVLLIGVTAAVVLHILPESVARAGWLTLVSAAVGWMLPEILERVWRQAVQRIDLVTISLALVGLVVHGILDGAVLAEPGFTSNALPLMILLHRIPDSLLIWLLVLPTAGWRAAAAALLVVAVATVVGYAFSESAITFLRGQVGTNDDQILAHFQALVAGSLLHLSTHKHQYRHSACEHKH